MEVWNTNPATLNPPAIAYSSIYFVQALLALQDEDEMAVIQTCVGVFQIGPPFLQTRHHKFEESLHEFQAQFLQESQYGWMVLYRLDPNVRGTGHSLHLQSTLVLT
jgi:hypothetical protein